MAAAQGRSLRGGGDRAWAEARALPATLGGSHLGLPAPSGLGAARLPPHQRGLGTCPRVAAHHSPRGHGVLLRGVGLHKARDGARQRMWTAGRNPHRRKLRQVPPRGPGAGAGPASRLPRDGRRLVRSGRERLRLHRGLCCDLEAGRRRQRLRVRKGQVGRQQLHRQQESCSIFQGRCKWHCQALRLQRQLAGRYPEPGRGIS
mmetsp:Transcript_2649/g.7412  ORF Transcript_2649/g.7412 Transcript_2649/m.7412 type:complete len:203 (+) Transcript_2649:211-819(+)